MDYNPKLMSELMMVESVRVDDYDDEMATAQ